MFNKHHFSFLDFYCFILIICIHIYVNICIHIWCLEFHISSPIRSRRAQYRRTRGGVQSLWSYQRYTAAQRRSTFQLRIRLHKLTGLLTSLDLRKPYTRRIICH